MTGIESQSKQETKGQGGRKKRPLNNCYWRLYYQLPNNRVCDLLTESMYWPQAPRSGGNPSVNTPVPTRMPAWWCKGRSTKVCGQLSTAAPSDGREDINTLLKPKAVVPKANMRGVLEWRMRAPRRKGERQDRRCSPITVIAYFKDNITHYN